MHPARLVAFLVGALAALAAVIVVVVPVSPNGYVCGSGLFPNNTVANPAFDTRPVSALPICTTVTNGFWVLAIVVVVFAIACFVFGARYRGTRTAQQVS